MFSLQHSPVKTLALSLVLVVAGTVGINSVFAQGVGPMPPQEKPKPANADAPLSDKLKESFKKMFTPQEGAATQTGTDDIKNGTGNAAPDASGAQPVVTAPKHPPLISQPPLKNAKVEEPEVDVQNPPIERIKIDDPKNPLGLADATEQMKGIISLIDTQSYAVARLKLAPLRQWLIDATEAHINLYKTLNNLPSARTQAEFEKQVALEFALLRDRAMYEQGRIYVAEKDYRKAVKELTEVIKSQPKSQIGIKSYEMLQEIGFTEKLHLTAQ